MSKILLSALFLVPFFGGVVAADKPSAICGDFLAELRKKPKSLEFLSCDAHRERQGKPLTAVYRVPGAHAAEVEQFLIREFGIKKVTHVCCEWASAQNSYVEKKNGRSFILGMGSDETLLYRRADWRKIPYFVVNVDLLTEEP